jgi:Leucine-rich repeat (LRR) protein
MNKINLLNELSFIEFPNLKNLELSGNNISSIELLQTIDFPSLS